MVVAAMTEGMVVVAMTGDMVAMDEGEVVAAVMEGTGAMVVAAAEVVVVVAIEVTGAMEVVEIITKTCQLTDITLCTHFSNMHFHYFIACDFFF